MTHKLPKEVRAFLSAAGKKGGKGCSERKRAHLERARAIKKQKRINNPQS